MSKSIEVQLDNILKSYLEEANNGAETVFKEVGKDTSRELKNTSPKGHSDDHYADGWTYKVSGWGMNASLVIYNKVKPGLTHLLENGHDVVVNGKSTGKRAGAHKHIEPAKDDATEELLNKLRDRL